MKLPLSWIKEYVELNKPAEIVAEDLLLSGTKVEEIKKDGSDYILDLEITSNRPDCLSVVGIARELAAIYDKRLNIDEYYPLESFTNSLDFEIHQSNPSLAPVYAAVVVEDLSIKKSSSFIKDRLEKSGIRSLSNLIDITNYVMLETGQPMHAFDYDQISGHILKIRVSKEGEQVTPIDGVERTLKEGVIIIEDNEKLIDLAGIMGGKNTEITSETKRSLLLVPIYDPLRIRKASGYLGLRTEASNRFEKLLDPKLPRTALSRAIDLIEKECGGKVASRIESFSSIDEQPEEVDLDLADVENMLGVEIPEEEVERILLGLGFEILRLPLSQLPTLRVTPPSWRRDILIPEDLIEEIGRIYGYNNLPYTLPSGTPPAKPDNRDWERDLKNTLASWGFVETVGYTLLSGTELSNLGLDLANFPKVTLPMSVDFEYLRPNFLIGLLKAAQLNSRNGVTSSYFEIGRVFLEKFSLKNLLTNQPKHLELLIPTKDFLSAKGNLQSIFSKLRIKEEFNLNSHKNSYLNEELSFELTLDKERIGYFGKLSERVLTSFDLSGSWYYTQLNLDALIKHSQEPKEFESLPKFPPTSQDIALVIDREVPIPKIVAQIKSNGGRSLKKVQVFDVFTNPNLGENKKSVALKLVFQSASKTLTDKDVNTLKEKIVKNLERDLQAKIRS